MGCIRAVVVCIGVSAAHTRGEIRALGTDCCRGVVIASHRVRASRTAHKLTRAIFIGGLVVVVACRGVGAAEGDAREVVARAVIDGGRGVVVAAKGVGAACASIEIAAAIQFRGIPVVVARSGVRASLNFKGVTHAISVGVQQAIAVAVVARFGELTRGRVDGVGVVVAGAWAQTACARSEFA